MYAPRSTRGAPAEGPAMSKRPFPLARVYTLLEPGPVVLLATAHRGVPNVMAMSWHSMLEFDPPLVGCVVSDRNHSHRLLAASGECTINVPTVELARQVVRCGNSSGAKVDKFRRYGLTARPASLVGAPLVEECAANLECRVVDRSLVRRYSMFVVQVLKAWISPGSQPLRTIHHLGRGRFMVAGETIRLPSRMK